jgi:hypothetical protein
LEILDWLFLYSTRSATRCGLPWPRRNERFLPRRTATGGRLPSSAIMQCLSAGVSTDRLAYMGAGLTKEVSMTDVLSLRQAGAGAVGRSKRAGRAPRRPPDRASVTPPRCGLHRRHSAAMPRADSAPLARTWSGHPRLRRGCGYDGRRHGWPDQIRPQGANVVPGWAGNSTHRGAFALDPR